MKSYLLAATAALAAYGAPVAAQQAITTPILKSVNNFRDLAGISATYGGTGFANTTAHDGVMRTGVFYRSNALTLSAADLATVSSLGITKDIDLRTPGEIASTPDVVPVGAAYLNINILGIGSAATASIASAKSGAEAIAGMEGMYRGFVTEATDRAGFRDTLLQLAQTPGAVLFHCTSGKDRTGWTSAILETIAGVAPSTIMSDYLATNAYSHVPQTLASLPASIAAIFGPVLGVQQSFLQASLDAVSANYGSMQAYLTEGLGLTQADIYVLRAKMVEFQSLPGEAGLSGNARAGAGFLRALQDSPLSGAYTAYNFYLQSAVDAGTLGGVEARVGGQVHADSLSHLLREPSRIDSAIRGAVDGRDLAPGQTGAWQIDLADNFRTNGADGVDSARERGFGALFGATRRFDDNASGYFGLGHTWDKVSSAGADADVNAFVVVAGARYGFSGLQSGPYAAAGVQVELANYDADRPLGGGLGAPHGETNGEVYSGRVELGQVIQQRALSITPHIGVEVVHGRMDSFAERGGELALRVSDLNETHTDLQLGVDLAGTATHMGGWTLTPWGHVEYERALDDPTVTSKGQLYQFVVFQDSAYQSRDLGRVGLNLTAQRGPLSVDAGVNGAFAADSSGIGGRIAIGYRF